MMEFINNIYVRHRQFWTRQSFFLVLGGVVFFMVALVIQHFAHNYIDHRAVVTPVGDLFLDILPAVNLDFFIVQGALISSFMVVMLLVAYPQYLPFSLKSVAFFLIARSFFISLTHLGVNLHQVTLHANGIGFGAYDFLYNAKNDFFFSGHVGATFLIALIFWHKPFWRDFFLIISFVFGVSMILAHMHYSIDVFAAPFITYGLFTMGMHVFKKDYQLIH